MYTSFHRCRERFQSEITPDVSLEGYIDRTKPYGDSYTLNTTSRLSDRGTVVKTLSEITMDELHPGPPWRSGGPFLNVVYYNSPRYQAFNHTVYNATKSYKYVFYYATRCAALGVYPGSVINDALSLLSSKGDSFEADALNRGVHAWSTFRPTNSGANLGQFLGELRDVPRMFRDSARDFARVYRELGGSRETFGPSRVANTYLNTQFGWLPFLSDLRSFYNTTKTLDRRVKQLRRDNGRWIRRSGPCGSFPDELDDDFEVENTYGFTPSAVSSCYSSSKGRFRVSRGTSGNAWFSGAFRYWIPGKPDSWLWNARAYALLYGLQPSPSLIYELTPWSWLIDWCSSMGDSIANMSSTLFDNLVAKYAYVMVHSKAFARYVGTCDFISGPVTLTWEDRAELKSRFPASPFGFFLSSSDFSARQWSILAALGLSRR